MTDPEILKRLDRIETILLQTPEVMAATFITMWEKWEKAKFQGLSATDLWDIIPPNLPQSQSSDGEDPGASEERDGNTHFSEVMTLYANNEPYQKELHISLPYPYWCEFERQSFFRDLISNSHQ